MKVLEAQSAVLSNYEVYTYLTAQKEKYDTLPGRETLDTLVKELLAYFAEAPNPLAQTPLTYNETTIRTLLEKLRTFDLTKPETIMIMNLRPTKPDILNTVVEELETRFTEERQWEICKAIVEALGKPDEEAERRAMTRNAERARRHQVETEARLRAESGANGH